MLESKGGDRMENRGVFFESDFTHKLMEEILSDFYAFREEYPEISLQDYLQLRQTAILDSVAYI